MTYKIIGDSCFDINAEDRACSCYQRIPLTLMIGEKCYPDDETFDQAAFIKNMKSYPELPKSACPAPEAFLNAFEEADVQMIFVVTLSQHLSGTYNAALVAKHMFEEEHLNSSKKIAVFSSDSASIGEALIGRKIRELAESGLSFEEIISGTERYIYSMHTYFVLENLDNLRKNGRLTGLQAFFASALNIKPVMGAEHGVIVKKNQSRGINKALAKLAEILIEETPHPEKRTLGIAHCNCPERAEYLKKQLCARTTFRDIYITETAGIATLYANDGGIIVSC